PASTTSSRGSAKPASTRSSSGSCATSPLSALPSNNLLQGRGMRGNSRGCVGPAHHPGNNLLLGSGACRDEDEVGREAEEEPGQHSPGDERLAAEQPADVQQLDHDEQDRAGREREERN